MVQGSLREKLTHSERIIARDWGQVFDQQTTRTVNQVRQKKAVVIFPVTLGLLGSPSALVICVLEKPPDLKANVVLLCRPNLTEIQFIYNDLHRS